MATKKIIFVAESAISATKMELVAKSEGFWQLKQFSSQMYSYWRLKINLVADYIGFTD